jgi:hypothetical protein
MQNLDMSATSVTSVSKQSSPLQNYAAEHEERKEPRNVPAVPRITAPFLGDESWGLGLGLGLGVVRQKSRVVAMQVSVVVIKGRRLADQRLSERLKDPRKGNGGDSLRWGLLSGVLLRGPRLLGPQNFLVSTSCLKNVSFVIKYTLQYLCLLDLLIFF